MCNEDILKRTEEGMKASNKVLIRELVRDLEEKGISPAWAIDGEIKKLKILQKKDATAFEKELKKFGLEKSDFCLIEEEHQKKSKKALSLVKDIILIHKKSAKIKTYKSGSTRWIADFHHDLENNFFTN
jgi:hypothetical protein